MESQVVGCSLTCGHRRVTSSILIGRIAKRNEIGKICDCTTSLGDNLTTVFGASPCMAVAGLSTQPYCVQGRNTMLPGYRMWLIPLSLAGF